MSWYQQHENINIYFRAHIIWLCLLCKVLEHIDLDTMNLPPCLLFRILNSSYHLGFKIRNSARRTKSWSNRAIIKSSFHYILLKSYIAPRFGHYFGTHRDRLSISFLWLISSLITVWISSTMMQPFQNQVLSCTQPLNT